MAYIDGANTVGSGSTRKTLTDSIIRLVEKIQRSEQLLSINNSDDPSKEPTVMSSKPDVLMTGVDELVKRMTRINDILEAL